MGVRGFRARLLWSRFFALIRRLTAHGDVDLHTMVFCWLGLNSVALNVVGRSVQVVARRNAAIWPHNGDGKNRSGDGDRNGREDDCGLHVEVVLGSVVVRYSF